MRTLACTLLFLAAACGPIGATSLIDDAEVATIRAHASDGDKFAAYDTTAADLYLAKAKEEQGHAHYSAAMDLAREAVRHADAAAKKAGERRTGDAPPVAPRATIQHDGSGK